VFVTTPQPRAAFALDQVEWREVLGRSPASLPVVFEA